MKYGSDSIQNNETSFTSQVRGKKRDRVDQATNPIKRERVSKLDDSDSAFCKFDNNMIKSELSKISENGALICTNGVEKLVQMMQVDNSKKIDLTGRVLLADVIAATDKFDCLNKFVQVRGVPVLDEWLQKAHKGKTGDGNSPKESDKAIEELLLALLRALDKLPVNLHALQTCNIGKSVNHLRSHKNLEIQKKARSLVDTWKKRVDAEMKTSDAKPAGISQAVTWQVKPGFSEVSHAGHPCNGSRELSMKSSITQQSTCNGLSGKSYTLIVTSGELQSSSFAPVGIMLKDSLTKVSGSGGTLDIPQSAAKEEKNSSSQSCSSDHGKTVGSSLKEDASSTAGSVNDIKSFGVSSSNRRSSNGFIISSTFGGPKESTPLKLGSLNQNSITEKVSKAGFYCERTVNLSGSEHCSSHRLIFRLPKPCCSPGRSSSGGSLEDPSASSRVSSPDGDHKVTETNDTTRAHVVADVNAESWQSNDVKDGLVGYDDRGKLSMIAPIDGEMDEAVKIMETSIAVCSFSCDGKCARVAEPNTRDSCSSINALTECCTKYSETRIPFSGGEDIGMNLLASVATGEMLNSNIVSPASSSKGSLAIEDPCTGSNEAKPIFSSGDFGSKIMSPSDENIDSDSLINRKSNGPVLTKDEKKVLAAKISGDSKRTQEIGLLYDVLEEEFDAKDANQKQDDRSIGCLVTEDLTDSKSMVTCPMDQIKTSSSSGPQISEARKFASYSVSKSLFHGVVYEGAVSGRDVEKAAIVESSRQHLDAKVEAELERKHDDALICSSVTDKVSSPENTDIFSIKRFDGLDQHLERTDIDRSVVLPSNHKASGGSICSSLGMTKYGHITERKASTKHDQVSTIHKEVRPCIRMFGGDAERKVEFAPSRKIFSCATTAEQKVGTRLDFDLNEGIHGDDVIQIEPLSTTVIDCSHTVRFSSLSRFASSPLRNGSSSFLTVSAPAKGPFVPCENLLKNKGEVGWKGSASTSAFRPADRRKILKMSINSFDAHSSNMTMANKIHPFEFDLNVTDERVVEHLSSQNFAQTTGSASSVISNHGLPRATGGLGLDLNSLDEGAENGQLLAATRCHFEVPFLPGRPRPVGFPTGEANMQRDFDLNSGSGIDDVGTELLSKIQNPRKCNNILAAPYTGLRMNRVEFGSGWLPPRHSYPIVASPSFLRDRGERSYPIVAGAQAILGPITGTGTFGSDMCRGPLLSSSPAMACSPDAAAFTYEGFPFSTNFPLTSSSFSAASTNYIDPSFGGNSYFPPVPSPLAGPYVISHQESSGAVGSERSKNWGWQGLDLNTGPGTVDEVKDDRLPSSLRHLHVASLHGFVEDQARQFQVADSVLKRKEPGGGWGPERFNFKQPSWH
ncbi:hypothetical protein KSP40_PGU019322 [Platanthera guangdongensis]|uniref:TFIIS N-terminal domain-containing protein n=1 Tax=Platanthera guangdongensis TaxID=2320717 RepID=A0ABR2LWV5_9ASPA